MPGDCVNYTKSWIGYRGMLKENRLVAAIAWLPWFIEAHSLHETCQVDMIKVKSFDLVEPSMSDLELFGSRMSKLLGLDGKDKRPSFRRMQRPFDSRIGVASCT